MVLTVTDGPPPPVDCGVVAVEDGYSATECIINYYNIMHLGLAGWLLDQSSIIIIVSE